MPSADVHGGRFTGNDAGIGARGGSTAALVRGTSVTGSRSNAVTLRDASGAGVTGATRTTVVLP